MLSRWLFSELPPDTSGHLVLAGEWSWLVQGAVCFICLAILALTVWNYRALSLPRRAGMVAIRAIVLGLLLFLFYQPVLVEETVQKSRNTVAFLLDHSTSMELETGDGSRAEVLENLLAEHEDDIGTLKEDSDLRFFRFGENLADIEDPTARWETQDKASSLLEALETLQEKLGSRDLGGIVVLSDGALTGLMSERLSNATALDEETLRFLDSLQVPIHTITPVDPNNIKDVSVVELRANHFAFHLNAMELETTVRATGYPKGTQITVSLFEDGQPISSQIIHSDPEASEHDLTFEVVPRKMGTRVYSIVSTPLPGEIHVGNNEEHALVKIMRDRLRILQICGHPSWDERFLRNFLKRDPDVDLISFFILVNPRNAFAVSQQDTTLIPFPARELFVEELGGFDLVIFQDFNYGPFQTRQHLWRIRDFVRDGGAFLMLGGARTFSEGDYFGTEITEILPVEIERSTGNRETLDETLFSPRLTRAGKVHPVTRLTPDPLENQVLWEGVPKLEGVNKTLHLKPGATTLLEHPTLRNSRGEPMPVVAASEAGEGRVLTVMTDSTWRWTFSEELKGSSIYSPFLQNAIRWLTRDPELELIRVEVSESQPTTKANVTIRAQVYDTNYNPAPNYPVDVSITRRSATGGWAGEKTYILQESGKTGEDGVFSLQFSPELPGIYDVVAKARIAQRQSTAKQVLIAREDALESQHMIPRQPYLEWISKATKGESRSASDGLTDLPFRNPELLTVTQRKEHPLWSGVEILLLAFLLMGTEWWLRRRMGYL